MVYLSFYPLLFMSFLFSAICKASSGKHFAFCISFSWRWSWSLPYLQCQEPSSIVLQALCLSDLFPWIYLSLPLYYHEIWFSPYLNGLVVFPPFFNLSLNFAIRRSWSEPQSASSLGFVDCIELLCLVARNIISLFSVLTIWGCPCVQLSVVLLEKGVCYDQCVLLVNLC